MAIDRVESTRWQILWRCPKCHTEFSSIVYDQKLHFEFQVIDFVKRARMIASDDEPEWRTEDAWAYDYNPDARGYDFSQRKKIRPLGE